LRTSGSGNSLSSSTVLVKKQTVAQPFKNPITIMESERSSSVHGKPSLLYSNTDKLNGHTDILNGPTHHHSDSFARRQTGQRLPLFKLTLKMATATLAATSGNIVLYATQARKPIQRLAFCDVLALVRFPLVFFVVNLYAFWTICAFDLLPPQNQIWDCHCRKWRDIILFLSQHNSVLAIPLRTGSTQRTLSD